MDTQIKICKTCGVAKPIDQYQKSGKDRKGEIRYKSICKECSKDKQTVQYRRDTKKLYHFNCKNCGKADSHYDKRYTTFCSRKCSFEYQTKNAKGVTSKPKMNDVCIICGGILNKNYKYCDTCKEIQKQKSKEERLKRKTIQIAKITARKSERKAEREVALNKICSMCNSPFKANRRNTKTCDSCRYVKKLLRDISRGKRSKSALPTKFDRIDLDITHEKLIERDKNICYLCGKPCDSNHFIHDEKGAFIALDNYPSIEHVIALTNRGTHTWDNVKLAHFHCNSIKSDKTIDEAKAQLKFFL